jgi:chemotaxis family two-component system sensor kinase Cph1
VRPTPGPKFRIGRLPVLSGDPVGFRQLFTNLVDNAVRHGGRSDLVVVVDGRECPDGGVELSVRDNGRGLPAEHRGRVFGVFEGLEGPATSDGTGMGPGHLPQDRRGPGGRHRHPGRPRHRRPDPAPGRRHRPLPLPAADRRGGPVRP